MIINHITLLSIIELMSIASANILLSDQHNMVKNDKVRPFIGEAISFLIEDAKRVNQDSKKTQSQEIIAKLFRELGYDIVRVGTSIADAGFEVMEVLSEDGFKLHNNLYKLGKATIAIANLLEDEKPHEKSLQEAKESLDTEITKLTRMILPYNTQQISDTHVNGLMQKPMQVIEPAVQDAAKKYMVTQSIPKNKDDGKSEFAGDIENKVKLSNPPVLKNSNLYRS